MATYRNKSDDTVQVGVGLPYPQSVEPDATFTVPEDVAENYDLNARFVRVDVPSVSANAKPAKADASAPTTGK